MDKDVKKELKDTEQELMLELKIKTDAFLKKLKEHSKQRRVKM